MLTIFIGTTSDQRSAFVAEQEHENKQLEAILAHFDRRQTKRDAKIKKLRAELERLEAKSDLDRKIWHAACDRHIARNKHLCALFDELNAQEKSA